MNKNELKTLVQKYFNLVEANTTPEIKFAEATLADGTKITNMSEGDFAVGQELHVITAEGEHVLAPAGEHTTESGIVITVDEAGIITGVHYPDAEGEGSLEEEAPAEEAATEEPIAEEMEEHEVSPEGEVSEEVEVESPIEESTETPVAEIVEAVIEAISGEIEEMKSKVAMMEEKLAAYEEKMAAPAASPVAKAAFNRTNKTESKKEVSAKDIQKEMILAAFKKRK